MRRCQVRLLGGKLQSAVDSQQYNASSLIKNELTISSNFLQSGWLHLVWMSPNYLRWWSLPNKCSMSFERVIQKNFRRKNCVLLFFNCKINTIWWEQKRSTVETIECKFLTEKNCYSNTLSLYWASSVKILWKYCTPLKKTIWAFSNSFSLFKKICVHCFRPLLLLVTTQLETFL